jgi:hypothetical protein
MRLVEIKGVIVSDHTGNTVSFPARDFEVLPNGALELKHITRTTFAPGQWTFVQFDVQPAVDPRDAAYGPEHVDVTPP